MTKAADLRRRIDAIEKATSGSIVARLRMLTSDERTIYNQWRERCERWRSHLKPDEVYARFLNGDVGPLLPRSIRERLFGSMPVITADMTTEQAADVYARYLRES